MKKAIALLSILLLGQVGLSLYIYAPHGPSEGSNPNLLAFKSDQVDTILIEDDQKHQVTLSHQGDHWSVTNADNFPADETAVANLLSRLGKLKAGWPVATTAEAADHFKVSDQTFVRRLSLNHGDQTLTRLYLGGSPGIRKIYARADGHTDIHSVLFNAFDANAKVDDWIDKHPFKVPEPKISAVHLPGLKLERNDKGLALDDLKDGEESNGDETAALVEYLADIPIVGLAGKDDKTDKDGGLEFSLTIQGEGKRDYRFLKMSQGVDYLADVTGRNRRFIVSASTVDHIKSFSRDKLVSLKTGAHSEPPMNQSKGP